MACRNSKSGSMTKRILVVEDQEDLRGLPEDKLKSIRSHAKFIADLNAA